MKRWPTDEEIAQLEEEEKQVSDLYDEEPDPICQCGRPGYACWCFNLAQEVGYWPDGTTWAQSIGEEQADE